MHQFILIFISLILFVSSCFAGELERHDKSSWVEKSWVYDSIFRYPFEGDERILDIGCGSGELTFSLSQRVPKGVVEGIDIVPGLIEHANQTWKNENLQFEIEDARELKSGREFDLITLFFSFHWIKDQEQLVSSCRRLLSDRGRIWIVAPSGIAPGLQDIIDLVCQKPMWSGFFTNFDMPVRYLSIEETFWLFRKHDLCLIYTKSKMKKILFGSRRDFHQALSLSLPHLAAIPDAMRDSFVSDLLDEYLIAYPADEYQRPFCFMEVFETIATQTDKCRQIW